MFSLPEDSSVIDLSQNEISYLDDFPLLDELKLLNLTDNLIVEIEDDIFADLDSLETLILSRNKIRFIHEDLFEWGPENLRKLYLDHNHLEAIQHYDFLSLEKIEEIDLSFNWLYTIDHLAFDELEHLTVN